MFPFFLEITKEMEKWIDEYCKRKYSKYFTLYFIEFVVKVADESILVCSNMGPEVGLPKMFLLLS
jgi:hypothetical protein